MFTEPWHHTLTVSITVVLIFAIMIGGPTYCQMQANQQTHEQQMKCISVSGVYVYPTGQCITRIP
jgi:hypothetical protein